MPQYTQTFKENWKDKNLQFELESYVDEIGWDELIEQLNKFFSRQPLRRGVWRVALDLDYKDAVEAAELDIDVNMQHIVAGR